MVALPKVVMSRERATSCFDVMSRVNRRIHPTEHHEYAPQAQTLNPTFGVSYKATSQYTIKMPRPKRTKVAPSAPTARVATAAPLTNLPTQQRNTANAPTGRVATASDDSEGIVTTSTTLRNRRGVEKRDVFMTGGLGTGDTQYAHRKPGATRPKAAAVDTSRALQQAKVIDGLKKRRDAALAAQKVSVVEVPSSIPGSGAEDEGFAAGGEDLEAMRRDERVGPATEFRTQEAPGVEASILALANFKRRPRQPSILQIVQQDGDTVDNSLYDVSDAEEDKKNAVDQVGHPQPEEETGFRAQRTPGAEVSILALANFKRRPRQPSILQVSIQQGVDDADNHDLFNDDGDEDQIGAFDPEDESTPFIVSKTKSQLEAILSPSPSSPTPKSLPGSSSKKRKLTPVEVQVPRSSPPEARSSPSAAHQNNENYNSPLLNDDDQEPPSEQAEAHSDREPTPQIWSDTLAPPLSSSPSQIPPHSPPRPEHSARPTTAQAKRKQPARNNPPLANRNDSTMNPSILPPKTRTRTRQPLSTATLQTLLPRRRARPRPSTFDIPSSDDINVGDEETDPSIPANDDDDDELSHAPAKKPSARKRATKTATAAAAGISKKSSPVKKQRATATAAASISSKKSGATAKKAATGGVGVGGEGPGSKTKRTYTRRVVSDKDKENADPNPGRSHDGPHDDVNSRESGEEGGQGDVRLRIGGAELERAARWFREVEKWELDFEEVTGSSDSMMRDAR